MKHILITIIVAVLLVGCGESQQSAPAPEAKPEPPTAKAPDISIHDAAKKGNPEDVKLHDAAKKGNLEAVKQHLAAGANVNAKDDDGWTPLHSAAFKGHKKIAELLIAKGASVNANGYMEQTPLDVATHPDNPNDIAETTLLLRKHGGKTGKPAINLLQQMGDIELKAEALDISINRAASEGNVEAVKQYLADGVDVNAKDEDGWTVLDNALGSKNEELINFVKANGGKSNADKSIFIASGIGDLEAVKQHLATGADVNAKDENGWTPLHFACDQRNVAVFLINKGAKVNAVHKDGWTPLDEAIDSNDFQTADLLRKHGGKTGEELKAEGK
jgi:ankyrin repeat protein